MLLGALLTARCVFLQVSRAQGLLIAHQWVGDQLGWLRPCSNRILSLFPVCHQRSDLMAEGPS